MEGHQGRQGAVVLEKGKQVDAGVAEVDVEEVRVPPLEDAEQGTVFATVDEGGFAADVFEVEAAEEVAPGRGDDFDFGEGKFFSALGIGNALQPAERRSLPRATKKLRETGAFL